MANISANAASRLRVDESWRVVLLGMPRLERARPQATVRLSPKDAALLAVVALDGPVTPDHVAALLWPASDAKKAVSSLRQRLFRLRRETGSHIVTSGLQLQLAPGVQTDLAGSVAQIASDELSCRDELLGNLESRDADVLHSQKNELLSPAKQLKLLGVICMAVGTIFTLTVILPIAGIPFVIFGFWCWRFGKQNIAAVEAGYGEYLASAR